MNEKIKDILEWIYCIIIAVVLALLFRYLLWIVVEYTYIRPLIFGGVLWMISLYGCLH